MCQSQNWGRNLRFEPSCINIAQSIIINTKSHSAQTNRENKCSLLTSVRHVRFDRRIPLKSCLLSALLMELNCLKPQIRARTYPGKGRKKDRGSVAGGITAATLQFPEIHQAGERQALRSAILVVASVACLCLMALVCGSELTECCYGSSLHGVRRE